MGRSVQLLAAVVVVTLTASLQLRSASAAPEQVHLSVTERPDEIVVWWITENEPRRSEVLYGSDKLRLDKRATSNRVERYRYKGTRMQGGYTSGYINEVVLKDLELDKLQRTYYYKCGDEGNGWSEVFSFRTRPQHPDAPVTFVAHGDQDAGQDDTSKTREVLNYMVRYHEQSPTDLYLHVGDHSYADGNQHEWDYYGRVMQEYVSQVPIVAAVGNHELENRNTYDPWLHRWRHGERDSNEFWFSFDYGPVHFVILTSEHEVRRQWDWLEDDLRRAEGNRERVPWIVVLAHHPMYNAGRKSMGRENIRNVESTFQRHKVSLFICGHCHNYERTKPMFREEVLDRGDGRLNDPYIQPLFQNSDNEQWGTIHMIVGMGGRRGDLCPRKKWTHGRPQGGRGSAFFTVDRSQLVWRYLDIEGRTRDEFRICSQPGCADAPPVEGESKLWRSFSSKFAFDGPTDDHERNDEDAGASKRADKGATGDTAGDDDEEGVVKEKDIPSGEPEKGLQSGLPSTPGGGVSEVVETRLDDGADDNDESQSPSDLLYLENNPPVLRDPENCPTSIVSINLGEVDPSTGQVSAQSEAEAPGCHTGWLEEDVDEGQRPSSAEEGGGAQSRSKDAETKDFGDSTKSSMGITDILSSGTGIAAAVTVGVAVILGVGLVATAVVLLLRRRHEGSPDAQCAPHHAPPTTEAGRHGGSAHDDDEPKKFGVSVASTDGESGSDAFPAFEEAAADVTGEAAALGDVGGQSLSDAGDVYSYPVVPSVEPTPRHAAFIFHSPRGPG